LCGLNKQLRDRHDEETRWLGDTADAVIYLVGQVARVTDQAFLQEFTQTTGGRSSALNAIGVLSKIELQPEVLARRHELSAKIASQLEGIFYQASKGRNSRHPRSTKVFALVRDALPSQAPRTMYPEFVQSSSP